MSTGLCKLRDGEVITLVNKIVPNRRDNDLPYLQFAGAIYEELNAQHLVLVRKLQAENDQRANALADARVELLDWMSAVGPDEDSAHCVELIDAALPAGEVNHDKPN